MAKILVADDEPKIRKLVCDFLKKFGFETCETSDGDETYSYFSENRDDISLIILDIMMPGLNGWKVCEKIRQFSTVPIILLTARGEEFDELMSAIEATRAELHAAIDDKIIRFAGTDLW